MITAVFLNGLCCVYRGKPQEKCPFCEACYMPESKGAVCNVCQVSGVGVCVQLLV